jgi:hypothetical protein
MDVESRLDVLSVEINRELADGARVDYRDDRTQTAVLEVGRDPAPISHGLHLLVTVLTAGAWLIVWVIVVVVRPSSTRGRLMIQIDQDGVPQRQMIGETGLIQDKAPSRRGPSPDALRVLVHSPAAVFFLGMMLIVAVLMVASALR